MRRLRILGGIVTLGYWQAVGLYVPLLMMTHLGLALDRRFATFLAPTFDLGLIVLAAPLAALTYRHWLPYARTPYFAWAACLTVVLWINLARLYFGDMPILDEEMIDEVNEAQRIALWFAIGYLFYLVPPEHFRFGLLVALFFIPGMIIADFFFVEFLNEPGVRPKARAEGLYLNPNQACEAVIVIGILNLRRFRGVLAVVAYTVMCIGILLTFSRAGIVAVMMFGAILILRGKLSKLVLVVPIVLSLSFSTFLMYAQNTLEDLGYGASVVNVLQRLSFFQDVGVDSLTEEQSGESRVNIIVPVLLDSLDKPITGHAVGTESEYGMNPHNQLLHVWYKYGAGGLLVWLALLYLIYRKGVKGGISWRNPALLFVIWFSFFSHNLYDARFWIAFYAFVLLVPVSAWYGEEASDGASDERLPPRRARGSGSSGRRRRRRSAFSF